MAGPQPIPQKRSLPGRRAAPSGFIARRARGWGGGGSVAERGGDDFEAVAGFPFVLRPDGRLEAGCFFGGTVGVDEALHRIGAQAEVADRRSEEHTSELQSLMRISYAVFCCKQKKKK